MNQRGVSVFVLFVASALAIPSSTAHALDVQFPCAGAAQGDANFPSCTADWVTVCSSKTKDCTKKGIVGLFQKSLTDAVQRQAEGIYDGVWSQRMKDEKGNYNMVPDSDKLQRPVCTRVPLDILGNSSPGYCKSESDQNHLSQHCGPFGLVNSNKNGFVSFQLQMKSLDGFSAGRESSELAGMYAVALSHYYHTLLKQVIDKQSITVDETLAAGCLAGAQDLNKAIENLKTNPVLNSLLQGCTDKGSCTQQKLQESYIHLERGFLALGECVALESTMISHKQFQDGLNDLLNGIAKDCGNQKKADKFAANQCYQNSYADKVNSQISNLWPQAAGSCK